MQGLTEREVRPLKGGGVMRKLKRSKQKQWRNFLSKVKFFATAFYYLVSLAVMLIALWDRFTG